MRCLGDSACNRTRREQKRIRMYDDVLYLLSPLAQGKLISKFERIGTAAKNDKFGDIRDKVPMCQVPGL